MNLDLNKCFDYGLINYNRFDYYRYLAAVSSNNPNLINSTVDPLSSLLISLNLSTNNPKISLSNLANLSSLSNNPNGLFAVTPNLTSPSNLTNSNLFIPINQSFVTNIPQNPNQCLKCKCNSPKSDEYSSNRLITCDSVEGDDGNLILHPSVQSAVTWKTNGTEESVVLSSSYESSNGETRMSYSGDDQTIRANSSSISNVPIIRAPRAIRKSNDMIIKGSSSSNSADSMTDRVNIQALLPKLLDRTERVFQKYYGDMLPNTKTKIFNANKSIVNQTVGSNEPKEQICYFCKNNGEPDYLYRSHIVRDPITNKTICPVLQRYRCELCHAIGFEAHTRSYCPLSKFIRQNCENIEAAKYFNMKVLTSQHKKKQILLNKLDKEIKENQQTKELDENKENEIVLSRT